MRKKQLLATLVMFSLMQGSVHAQTVQETLTAGNYNYNGDTYLTGSPIIELGDKSDPLNITVSNGDLYLDKTVNNIGKSNNLTFTADNIYFNNSGFNQPDTETHLIFNADKVVFNGGTGIQNTLGSKQIYDFNGALEFTGDFSGTAFYANSGGNYEPEDGGGTQTLNVKDGITIHDATGNGAFVQWHFNVKTPFIAVKDSSFDADGQYGAMVMMMYSDVMGEQDNTLSGKISVENVEASSRGDFGQAMGMYFEGGRTNLDNLTVNGFSMMEGYSAPIIGVVLSTESITNLNSLTINDVIGSGANGTAYGLQLASDDRERYGITDVDINDVNISNISSDNAQSFGAYVSGQSDSNNPVKIFWNSDDITITDITGTDAGGYIGFTGSELQTENIDIKRVTATKGDAVGFQTIGTKTTVNGNVNIDAIKGVNTAYGLVLGGGSIDGQKIQISDVKATSESGEAILIDAQLNGALSFDSATLTPNTKDSQFKYQGQYAEAASNETNNVLKMAVRSLSGAEVNLNNKNGIYSIVGTVLAGRGSQDTSVSGGCINIDGRQVNIFGDVYAGNGGEINITLNGAGSVLEGQVDDYHELNTLQQGTVYKNSAFTTGEVTQAGKITLDIDGGQWIARGQSFVDTISLDGGIIDMSQNDNSSVTVDTLSSKNGVLKMKLNTNDRTQSDMLYVTGSMSGNYQLIIDETNFDASKTEIDPLRFATVKGDVDISGINARSVDVGFFDTDYKIFTEDFVVGDEDNKVYNNSGVEGNDDHAADYKPGNGFAETTFNNDDTNLMIGGIEKQTVSDSGQTIINMSRANYSNAIYMDRLNKRIGEARYINPEDEQGMWVRLRHDRIGKEDAFRSQNTMYEMGYDVKQDCDNGDRRVGFAIDYMDGKTEYRNVAGDGDIKRYGLWLYDTWMGDKGHYADYVLKWGHLENDFDIYNSRGKVNGDYSNNVFSVSAEYGKKNDMGNDWYFEPQAQLQLARVTGADYVTSQNTKVSLDGINSLIGRAGFRLGKDMGERSTVYVKADVLHEFLGDQTISALDTTINGTYREIFENKGTWYDVGFGFATALGKDSYAFMDFEKSFGNDNDETYQINAGVQWTF